MPDQTTLALDHEARAMCTRRSPWLLELALLGYVRSVSQTVRWPDRWNSHFRCGDEVKLGQLRELRDQVRVANGLEPLGLGAAE